VRRCAAGLEVEQQGAAAALKYCGHRVVADEVSTTPHRLRVDHLLTHVLTYRLQ
jgi:hypothetical protein